MASVSRIRLYPIKSLNGVDVESTDICGSGRLENDREFALFDEDGSYVNGRQNELVHKVNASIDLQKRTVAFRIHDTDKEFSCSLDGIDDNPELEAWLTDFFGEPISVEHAQQANFNDSAGGVVPYRITASGPTFISEGTLEEVASWYSDLTPDDVFRRLRTNVVIGDVEPFWEDKLYSDVQASQGAPGTGVEFTVGDVTHYGIMCKPRCVVPSRNPETGELKKDFARTFIERRKETFPDWSDARRLGENIDYSDAKNYFYLTVVTRIPEREVGKDLSVGDGISIEGELPLLQTN